MDALVVDHSDRRIVGRFVTKFDAIPPFWNYLVGLDRNDLIAELVQNDLDQGATRTVISFEETCLICEGNGEPVEPEGWQRLQMISGAGDEVPAKRSRFGVKNHGLKAAFTIGDEIRLMSAGQTIVQTLYAKGRNRPPYPGASEHPMEDPQAPTEGCRVIVQYRDTALEPSQGEAIKLDAVSVDEVKALFESACKSVPEQFAGIVSPEITPQYEIVLQHWELGEARFLFSCTSPRKFAKEIDVFQRRCSVTGTFGLLPDDLRERAVRRLVPLKGVLKDRVADFFRRGRRFFIEVSWPIDANGKPKAGTGRYRYPIGYPASSQEARTGHSTHFNAPFASDNERHAPAGNEATNIELREACDSLLIDTLARYAIPRWGAAGLRPIVPGSDSDDGYEVVRGLLAVLAKRGALPVLNWRQAAEHALKRKTKRVKAVARRSLLRKSSREKRRYRFVVPSLTWAQSEILPALSLLCPPSEVQLDPRIDPDIICLLADGSTPGFGEVFVTFDQNDSFDRLIADGNQYFGAIENREYELSKLSIARAYLDLINLTIHEGKIDKEKEDELISASVLPDMYGHPTTLMKLYSAASLPSNIPNLRLPPILDPSLVTHDLFRRRNWRRKRFTMAEFLESGSLQAADEQTRRMFWKWLSRNGRKIARRDRSKLGDLVVWPDESGSLCKTSDLCEPRSGRVGTVLAGFIRRPHEQVRRSRLVSVGGKARTSISGVPTQEEIADWLGNRLARFEIGSQSKAATASELDRFEADLAILLKDAAVARLLKGLEVTLPALARDDSIQPRDKLVTPRGGNEQLALPGRFLLKNRSSPAWLDKLSAPLGAPTAEMLLGTFGEDPSNIAALHARLRYFLSVTEREDDQRIRLARMSIIPAHGDLRAPSELAFRGNRGDYWGAWKTRISTQGLSQDDQRRFRAAGVMSAFPKAAASREFFSWLSNQEKVVVQNHIACILLHILHPEGPMSWATTFTDAPFIPVRGGDGLRLVSLGAARSRPVYLSDAGEIGDAVLSRDNAVLLVIDRAKEVIKPISEPLRTLGIKSLREALKEPEGVTGFGDVTPASNDIVARFRELQSRRFRRTFLKRLSELGVELDLVRRDWWDRLAHVQRICFADDVEARYRFRRKPYLVRVAAGFDPGSGVFWMRSGPGFGKGNLYESLAGQLVFKPEARPIDLLALERAVGLEIDDPSFGRSTGSAAEVGGDGASTEESDQRGNMGDAQNELGEAEGGHFPFEPDPGRNTPNPGPMTNEPAGSSPGSGSGSGSTGSGGRGSPRQTPELEKKHIEELKRDHYASHCQMCLCERSPLELAPAGSYIEWEEVRRKVVQAHHPDLVAAGGARHAGNLILLCALHHDNYGPQLTRAGITAALRDSPKEMSICFGVDSLVNGQQIELTISGTGEIVKLFFTDYHVKHWLSQETAQH